MRYFKDTKDGFYAVCSENVNIHEDWIEITEAEADAIRQASIPAPIIPQVVSMRKARLALHQFGILDAIETSMATASKADQIEWEYATEVIRTSPLVVNMVASLGLTEQQVDELFTLADTL